MLKFKKNGVKNICLIGMMGSGKSLIGKDLSKIYKIDFIDTDIEIEKKVGKNINLIFNEYGEDYFREIEEEVCLKVLEYDNCIISMGGGSIINFKIRNVIKKNSFSIYLKVSRDILIKRLNKSKKRPLLNDKNKEDVINTLYQKRKIFYEKADLIIQNNDEKKDIINQIRNNIQ